MIIGSSSDPPRPDPPALPPGDLLLLDLLPGEWLRDLLLALLPLGAATRSRAINRIVTRLLPAPAAAAAAAPSSAPPALAAAAAPRPLRVSGLLLGPPSRKLAKRLANADPGCLAARDECGLDALALADAEALPPAEPGLVLISAPADLAVAEPPVEADDRPIISINGGGNPAKDDVALPLLLPEEPLLDPLRGAALANLTLAVLVGLLPPAPAAAAAPPPAPGGPSPSGKNISITPTIPPP